MYDRLSEHLRAKKVTLSDETRWILSNGSRALAFSTRSGPSYTGTLALVDAADLVPELSQFLNPVKPMIDLGGQLFLFSTSDKKRPISTFKASLEASTLNAPEGLMDDRADAYALVVALAWQPVAGASTLVAQGDPLTEYDRGTW